MWDALGAVPGVGPGTARTVRDQLSATIARYWHFTASDSIATTHRLITAEQWRFPELVESYSAQVVRPVETEIEQIVASVVAAGEFRDVDPAVTAMMLTALVNQLAGSTSVKTRGAPEKRLRELTDFWLALLDPADAAFAQADGAPVGRGALNN